MRIAFIGLGVMGAPMAANLLAAGHQLSLSRVTPGRHGALIDAGGEAADTAAAAAKDAEVVIVMVPDTPDVEEVLFGTDGVAESLQPGTLVIDMSSISPTATKEFAARITTAGGRYLDAPVSGGEVGAKAGSLSIMVGGSTEDFEQARPLFEVLGTNISHIGEVGAGQTAKVANQIIVALTIEAVAEALTFAEACRRRPGQGPGGAAGRVRLLQDLGAARRTHDQQVVRPGIPDPAAPQGPESGRVCRDRAGPGPAEHRAGPAADERCRRRR